MTNLSQNKPYKLVSGFKNIWVFLMHRLSPNEGRMHFFTLLPPNTSNAMAMVSMAGHIFVAIWHAARQATGLANTA